MCCVYMQLPLVIPSCTMFSRLIRSNHSDPERPSMLEHFWCMEIQPGPLPPPPSSLARTELDLLPGTVEPSPLSIDILSEDSSSNGLSPPHRLGKSKKMKRRNSGSISEEVTLSEVFSIMIHTDSCTHAHARTHALGSTLRLVIHTHGVLKHAIWVL